MRYSPRSRAYSQRKRNADLPPAEPCKVVSVFNLDKKKTDEQRLHDFFSKFGKVERVDLIKDKRVSNALLHIIYVRVIKVQRFHFSHT
jgi:RNA recognition motif-containing protein